DGAPAAGVCDGQSRPARCGRLWRRCDHRVSAPVEPGQVARRHRAPNRSADLMRAVTVLGAGSWGTALALHLGRLGHDVHLWARDQSLVDDMRARGANATYLPGVILPHSVTVTAAMDEALRDTDLIVSAIPSHGCRAVMRAAAPYVAREATVVS